MVKVFRSWDLDQGCLLPPGHMAHFVRDTVQQALDLSAILDTYSEEQCYPPYHPGEVAREICIAGLSGVSA